MCQEVPASLIIGAMLSRKKTGEISYSDLNNIKKAFRKIAPEYYIDFSRDSLDSVGKANRGRFTITDKGIKLCKPEIDKQERAKKYFDNVLGLHISNVINNACSSMKEPVGEQVEELIGH